MKNLCVTFESWTILDGTYSPLRKGEKVNLAFRLKPDRIKRLQNNKYCLAQKKYSDYSFCGEVICNYSSENLNLLVVDTGHYKFYIEGHNRIFPQLVGDFIQGEGQLFVDYYIWDETLENIENPPDIYYNFIIDGIFTVRIPEKFIVETETIIMSPTSLNSTKFTDDDIIELKNIEKDMSETYSFFLLDLKEIEGIT